MIEFKPKKEKNNRNYNNLSKIIYLQSVIRGFLTRIKIAKSIIAPIHTFFEYNQQNNINNFNMNMSNNNDIISQSTVIAQKDNLITNNLEKNLSIMNFNPSISRSIEINKEIIDNNYLNINLVSNYIYFII